MKIMDGIGKRIKKVREHYNLTQQIFGTTIGISRSHVSNIETGKENPSETLLILIYSKYNINENWLLKGTGEMFIENKQELVDDYLNDINENMILFMKIFNATTSHVKKENYSTLFSCFVSFLYFDEFSTIMDNQNLNSFKYVKSISELLFEMVDGIQEIYNQTKNFSQDYKKLLELKILFEEKLKLINKLYTEACNAVIEKKPEGFTL